MIIRVFRAVPRAGQESAYERLIRLDSVDLVQAQPGLVALYSGQAIDDDGQGEIVMVSVWEDQAAMEAFTGPDWQTPVALPDEDQLVASTTVRSYASWT
jgi:heme-degrading monooxygenase HmoA